MGATVETIARDGQALALHHYDASDPAAAVLVLPAMGTPARYYDRFAADLVDVGLAPSVLDLRGNGDSTPAPSRATRYGYRDLVDDLVTVVPAVRARHPDRPLVAVGHSLGGQLALLHAARTGGGGFAGIVLVASGLPYWRGYPGRTPPAVWAYTQAIGVVSRVYGQWPGWTFVGPQAGGVLTDWAATARRGSWAGVVDDATAAGLPRLTLPLLAVDVEHDRYTPPGTLGRLLEQVPRAAVTRMTYTAAAAGGPVDHMRWARSAGPLATRIAAFVAGLP